MEEYAFDSEADWLDHRAKHLNGSELASVCGEGRESPFTVFQRKTGRLPPVESTIPMEVGQRLEPYILEKYEEETGRKIVRPKAARVCYVSSDLPYLSATPDALTTIKTNRDPVEAKSTEVYFADQWRDGRTPDAALIQTYGQMFCLETDRASIAGLIGKMKFFTVDIERDPKFLDDVLTIADRFWWHVEHDTPPAVDGSASTKETLKFLHPDDSGEVVELDDILSQEVLQLQRTKATIKRFEEKRDLIQNRLAKALGNATFGRLSAGVAADDIDGISFKTSQRRGYVRKVQPSKARTLRFVKKGKMPNED